MTLIPDEHDRVFWQPGQVHIVLAGLDHQDWTQERFWNSLSAPEQVRASAYHLEDSRRRFVVSRGLLREHLGQICGQAPGDVVLRLNAEGKPFLDDHQLQFNISHSGDFVAQAFTMTQALGLDLELIRDRPFEKLAKRAFNAAEYAEFMAVAQTDRPQAFYFIWTRKEAAIKCLGTGYWMEREESLPELNYADLAEELKAHLGPGWAGCLASCEHNSQIHVHAHESLLG